MICNGVIRKHHDTLPVISVDKKTGKTITAKDVNFTFVGTFTKAKDVGNSKTFLFTGKGQLSSNKIKKLLYEGDWKKSEKMGLKIIITETVLPTESILGILKTITGQGKERFIN